MIAPDRKGPRLSGSSGEIVSLFILKDIGTSHVHDLLVATFYRFARLDDPPSMREAIAEHCDVNGIRGTILLANEGVNGTISGERQDVLGTLEFLGRYTGLEDLEWKESTAETHPFRRMRVRLKKEIVTLGVDGVDPSRSAGTYVKPRDWNALISDPDVIVIDTRNDYEVEIGSFTNAVNPEIDAFGELTDWLNAALSQSMPHVTAHVSHEEDCIQLLDAGRPGQGSSCEQISDALAITGCVCRLIEDSAVLPHR